MDRPSAGGVSESWQTCPTPPASRSRQELFIDFFDTDQVLENCEDIELITANIEHSFIGDLSFWITCPDGTEVLLMDNGASVDLTHGCTPEDLGGNDLGIVDVEGFDYSWNMDAGVGRLKQPGCGFADASGVLAVRGFV